ncbi:hypothetical protein HDU96_009484 [Phlyctochytrium bullatum]|nr:hypothetical protein HDU96_009484 [Phlyctochytrium bullatum]
MLHVEVALVLVAILQAAWGQVSTPCSMLSRVNAYRQTLRVAPLVVFIRSPYHEANLKDPRARFFGSGYTNGHWTQDFANADSTDVPFPIDCSKESGFMWTQPAVEGTDFVGTIRIMESCLDGVAGKGRPIQTARCDDRVKTQSWTLKKYGAGFYAQLSGTSLCLDVFNYSKMNGTVIGV